MNDMAATDAASVTGASESNNERMQHEPVNAGRTRDTSRVVVASTFTAEPLLEPLRFWMKTLQIDAAVEVAPYAQIMQELLSPQSRFGLNAAGFNVLLLRLEDWIRDRPEEGVAQHIEHLRVVVHDLLAAVTAFRSRTSGSLLVLLCPTSSSVPPPYIRALDAARCEIIAGLAAMANVHCWTHDDLMRLYPLSQFEDLRADRIGHIPYTNEYFAAIATLLARRIAVLVKPPYKVIAIDCDNTLWHGICGEVGAAGIELHPAHLELQRMLVQQHDAGILLCLCSKNNASDVEAVFAAHPQMQLREHHLVSRRVNWQAKSTNLQSLAKELDLALDSFIFIDDSPMECAEVRTHCPQVLTLQMPEDPLEVKHLIEHSWAFDRIGVTDEAKLRTAQYKQNRARLDALREATNLEQFLASLQLQVEVVAMEPEHLARVAELIQRTNQFNLTNIRRRAGEIQALWSAGELRALIVHVRDRFGDYGLVGAILFSLADRSLDVDTFVLSCRVLGRGVECRIVEELGRIAREAGREKLILRYRRTSRNAPARDFLTSSFGGFCRESQAHDATVAETMFEVPVEATSAEHLQSLSFDSASETASKSSGEAAPKQPAKMHWPQIAYQLSRIPDLVREIDRCAVCRQRGSAQYVGPRTHGEAAVVAIWAEILGIREIGIRDNFFDLGGDSLLAVRVVARVGSVLGLELSLLEMFESPTVEEIAAKLDNASRAHSPIGRRPRGDALPLSWSQRRLWFIDQLEGGSLAYHVPLALRLEGRLDRASLQAALDRLVERHEVLRTRFSKVDGEPIQQLALEASFALRYVDLDAAREQGAELLRESREEALAPFDLSTGPLVRGRLLRFSQSEHVLLITMHHMISDGWSIGVLIRELSILYQAFQRGLVDPLPALPIQYADYAQWQRESEGAQPEQSLAYWREHLVGAPELLSLPTDRLRPAVQSYRGATVTAMLDPELAAAVKALARRFDLTLAMVLYAAWAAVLSRVSGQDDVVVGMPVANRPRTELEGLIGFFVNTLALRLRFEHDLAVTDLLQRVKQIMLGAFAHQDVPFEKVVEALQPTRSLSYGPIFQVMFVLQNAPRTAARMEQMTFTEEETAVVTAQFDLSLEVQESHKGIVARLNYAADLFDGSTIERWIGYFSNTLCAMVEDPQRQLGKLPLMDERERRWILESFNATQAYYPQATLIHQLFEEQVERTPQAVAVIYQDRSLAYGELNSRANQLARYLVRRGVGPDQLVGLCVERSLEMIVGLLGILKAGGAYVPLDPGYPAERLGYMLEDAAPKVLLVQQHLRERIPSTTAAVVALDGDWSDIAQHSADDLDAQTLGLRPESLAYVIYTSGSTGRPKGAMIEHRNVLNLYQGLERLYGGQPGCRSVALNASLNFDASVQPLVQLLAGRSIAIVPQAVRQDASMLLDFIRQHRVNAIDCTPSQLKTWIAAGLLQSDSHELRRVLVGGEAIDPQLWQCLAGCADIAFYNVYGPTECTVDVTVADLNADTTAPHIGRPMVNRRILILDRHLHPVPIGVSGEIYVGGAGVGRGYLNRPELTAQRFIVDPFGEAGGRLYRTGDLGRWRNDGMIEYLGRNDQQVKVRGFRIELGEIEAQLLRCAQVKEGVVVVREGSADDKQLVAYVVPESPAGPTIAQLRASLKASLPEHMVPSAFVVLERLPLLPSGKLDRKALPMPDLGAYVSQQYEPPQGDMERLIAQILQGLLQVERVGRHDSFFELGGHSLLAMQVVARIQSALFIDVPIRTLFEFPTLRELSAQMSSLCSARLLDRLAGGGCEMDELLEMVTAMPEGEVQKLLREMAAG